MAKDTFILLGIILPSHFWYERKWEKNKKERIKKLKKKSISFLINKYKVIYVFSNYRVGKCA